MHSFNDIHDFDDAGRASHSSYSVNTAPSNSPTLLLPMELECNPILSLTPTIDPNLLQTSCSSEEDVSQLSAFLPVPRIPLILADSCRRAGGSSDFQSNAIVPFDSSDFISEAFSCKPDALGFVLNPEGKGCDATSTNSSAQRSQQLSIDGLFLDFVDMPTQCFALQDAFDELGDISFVTDVLPESTALADCDEPETLLTQTSGILSSAYCAPENLEHSGASVNQRPRQVLSASNSLKELSVFTGLVADINMFDKENSSTLCVKPQDLMGQIITQAMPHTESSVNAKSEDAQDDLAEIIASPPVKYLKAPEPDWPQIPTEHLPFLVERYLAHFVPNPAPMEAEGGKQRVKHDVVPDPAPPPYTPITAEILEAVEEPQPATDALELRTRFSDNTNFPRPRTASRTGGNVMDMYEFLIPQDVTLDKPHEGVPVIAVVQKTKYFLMAHPGERLSEELLFSFAGRLNTSGQQMPGYRCYVQGCSKTTKRKDHMADHVRTHLGEKPFQCSVCGMGFIRNNDCQRHENNHRPDKKFVCACKAAFSRRDLFVRHQKTACTLNHGATMPGCFRRPRKCGKAPTNERKGTPDGDDANDFDYVPGPIRCGVAGA